MTYIPLGVPNGAASLDATGKVPTTQLPIIPVGNLPIIPKTLGGFGQDVSTGLTNNQVAVVSGGAITIDNLPAASIPNTAVTAGAYPTAGSLPTFTVGADGRLTLAGSSTDGTNLTNLNAGNVTTGILPIARGGTNSATGDLVATNSLTTPKLNAATSGGTININVPGAGGVAEITTNNVIRFSLTDTSAFWAVNLLPAIDNSISFGSTAARLINLGVQNIQSGTAMLSLESNVVDGAAAQAMEINNVTTLTGTAQLLSLENAGIQKAAVQQDGAWIGPSAGTASASQHAFPTGTGNLVSVDATQTLTNKTIDGLSNTFVYGTPVSTGTTNSAGVSTALARTDHVHQDVVLQTAAGRVTANQTTTSATLVDLTGATVTITTITGSKVLVNASFATSNNATLGANNTIVLVVDGAVDSGCTQALPALSAAAQGGAFCRLVTGLAAGSHTFKLQWDTSGSTAQCRPVAAPNAEHASITVMEVRL